MEPKKILFVCVENAARSQMAEAFFRKYAPKNYQAASAGTRPSNTINPLVVQVMKEIGINLNENTPKKISQEMISQSTNTVNMGCMDSKECPALFLSDVINWNIEDPKGKTIDQVRIIRDQIESKIKELVIKLEKNRI